MPVRVSSFFAGRHSGARESSGCDSHRPFGLISPLTRASRKRVAGFRQEASNLQTFRFGHGSFFSLLCRRRLHDVSRGALSQMALTLHSTFVAKTISILVLLHAARLAPAITRLRHGPHFCNGRLARLRRFYGTDKLSEVISILGRALRHRP